MAYVIDREIYGKPKEKYWISYIKQRIRKNKNFLGFISGPTGAGKSHSCLRIAEERDPEFTIDRCIFIGLALMKLINSNALKKGSVIVFEEAGVEMSHKNWQSITNKMLNYLMQTFRHRNFILLMNSPYMDFVDASTRKLFHAEMQTVRIDYENKEVLLKPQLIQYNPRLKKFYYKRLRVIMPQGKVPVDIWRVAKPSEELWKSYEDKKKEFTTNLYNEIQEELIDYIEKKKGKKKKDLTAIQEDTLNMLKDGLKVDQIAIARGRAKTVVWATIRLIKKKGYIIKPLYEGGKLVGYNVEEPKGR